MLEMSWITAILQLYSQIADLFGNVIVKRIHIRLFDLLARFHYILNLLRTFKDFYFVFRKVISFTWIAWSCCDKCSVSYSFYVMSFLACSVLSLLW